MITAFCNHGNRFITTSTFCFDNNNNNIIVQQRHSRAGGKIVSDGLQTRREREEFNCSGVFTGGRGVLWNSTPFSQTFFFGYPKRYIIQFYFVNIIIHIPPRIKISCKYATKFKGSYRFLFSIIL